MYSSLFILMRSGNVCYWTLFWCNRNNPQNLWLTEILINIFPSPTPFSKFKYDKVNRLCTHSFQLGNCKMSKQTWLYGDCRDLSRRRIILGFSVTDNLYCRPIYQIFVKLLTFYCTNSRILYTIFFSGSYWLVLIVNRCLFVT